MLCYVERAFRYNGFLCYKFVEPSNWLGIIIKLRRVFYYLLVRPETGCKIHIRVTTTFRRDVQGQHANLVIEAYLYYIIRVKLEAYIYSVIGEGTVLQ